MQKRYLIPVLLTLFIVGLVWSGCKSRREATSLNNPAEDTRTASVLPKSEITNTPSSGYQTPLPEAISSQPTINRPPVIVKPPKPYNGQISPSHDELAQTPTIAIAPQNSQNPSESGSGVASERMKPDSMPKLAMMPRPAVSSEDNNSVNESKSPIVLSLDRNAENPLRESSPPAIGESPTAIKESSPPSVENATPKMALNSPISKWSAMARVQSVSSATAPIEETPPLPASAPPAPPPIIAPPDIPTNDSTPQKDLLSQSQETTANTEPPPQISPPSSEKQKPDDSSPANSYAVVNVFYGTDRAAEGSASVKNAIYQGYLTLTVAAALLTAVLALFAYRFLKRRFIKIFYALSLSATIFLGGLTGYSAIFGRLPGQTMVTKAAKLIYGDERGTLDFGVCEVSIPKRHEVGELESPSILRLELSEDPNKHVALLDVKRESNDEFYANLRNCVGQSKEKSALVFIHGYNMTFEDAARRTAQIAFDLKFPGAPILFSWPSQGKLLDYAVDETNVAWTVPHLRQFLNDISKQSGAKQIHLIAHSMGNRALASALRDLAMQPTDALTPHFDQVLLTAPDIDADVFKNDIAPAIAKMADRVTLYASSNDEALLLSKKLHGYPRAGEAGRDIVIVPGMDTVDVTAVDTSLLGHSYYGDSNSVLTDIVEVLEDAKPADQRKWLHPEYVGMKKYWVFQR